MFPFIIVAAVLYGIYRYAESKAVFQPHPQLVPGNLLAAPNMRTGHSYAFIAQTGLGADGFIAELAGVGAIVQPPLAGTGSPSQLSGIFLWMGPDNEPPEPAPAGVAWLSLAEVAPGTVP